MMGTDNGVEAAAASASAAEGEEEKNEKTNGETASSSQDSDDNDQEEEQQQQQPTMTQEGFPIPDTRAIVDNGGKWVQVLDSPRIVEYSVSGSTAADAHVVVNAYVAEYLAGSADANVWMQDYTDLNIKSISVSLPGFGNSSMAPGYSIAQWPLTDLLPVLQAEEVTEFCIWGCALSCLHALATVQAFNDETKFPKVVGLGLRAPYLPISVSQSAGLENGQPSFPTTNEVQRNTLKTKTFRFVIGKALDMVNYRPESFTEYMMEGPCFMKHGCFGAGAHHLVRFADEFPEEFQLLKSLIEKGITADAVLYNMAHDVALEVPALHNISVGSSNGTIPVLKGRHVVVWYGEDDADTPPSHGAYLAHTLQATYRRTFSGYGHYSASFAEMDVFLSRLLQCKEAFLKKEEPAST